MNIKIAFFTALLCGQFIASGVAPQAAEITIKINGLPGLLADVDVDPSYPVAAVRLIQNKIAEKKGVPNYLIQLAVGTQKYIGNDAEFIERVLANRNNVTAVLLQPEDTINLALNGVYEQVGARVQMKPIRGIAVVFLGTTKEDGKTTSQYAQECTEFILAFNQNNQTYFMDKTENIPANKRAEVMLAIVDAYKKIPDAGPGQIPADPIIDLGNGFRLRIEPGTRSLFLETNEEAVQLRFIVIVSQNPDSLAQAYPVIAEAFREIAKILNRP